MKQKTIKEVVSLEGIGIHSGKPSQITFRPADINTGYLFLKQGFLAKLSGRFVTSTNRGTSLLINEQTIDVVEHALAALSGLSIYNIIIELSGNEFPALDGSSLSYVEAFEKSGIVELNEEQEFLEIKEKLVIGDTDKGITIEPAESFSISYSGQFEVIGEQSYLFDSSNEEFKSAIAPARTFGYQEELEELKKKGLGLGASTKNALAISKQGYVNQPRFKSELARHKILDIMGDLALLCRPIKGKIIANKSGHKMNIDLLKKLEEVYGA